MSVERKEGVIIATVASLILLLMYLATNDYVFWYAEFGPMWFPYESNEMQEGGHPVVSSTEYPLRIRFVTGLMFMIPIITYGLLRATGILKRLFKFEEKLSVLVSSKDE